MLWFVVIVRQRTDQRESKGIGWVKKELILHMHIDMADRRGARIYFSWLCRLSVVPCACLEDATEACRASGPH
jgi:hypothetical protein